MVTEFPKLVGVPRFELGASWSRTKRDTKLRHTPMQIFAPLNILNQTAEDVKVFLHNFFFSVISA